MMFVFIKGNKMEEPSETLIWLLWKQINRKAFLIIFCGFGLIAILYFSLFTYFQGRFNGFGEKFQFISSFWKTFYSLYFVILLSEVSFQSFHVEELIFYVMNISLIFSYFKQVVSNDLIPGIIYPHCSSSSEEKYTLCREPW